MDLYFFQTFTHYFLHLIFPLFIGRVFFKKHWRRAYFIMLCTMLVDADHLTAVPIFNPERCSVGYHTLHSYPMIAIYLLGAIFLKGNFKIIAFGLLFHMFTDFQDFYFWRLF